MTSGVRRFWILPLLLGAVLSLLSCGGSESPRERLETTLHDMRDAVVAGQIGEFMDRVADDFSGSKGRFDRREFQGLLRGQLLKHTRVTATIISDDYQMYPGRASVKLEVLMTGGPGNWLPDTGRIYSIETGWREHDSQWQLISADWSL